MLVVMMPVVVVVVVSVAQGPGGKAAVGKSIHWHVSRRGGDR